MSLQEVFSYWNERLEHSYNEKGSGNISCSLLALALAEKLVEEGKDYEIVCLHPELNGTYKDLKWGGHVVVRSEGLVYDPIVSRPMELEEYLEELFPGQVKRIRPISLPLCKENPYLGLSDLSSEVAL